MTRIFLAVVGVLYILLSLWCAVQPAKTAGSIGFTLRAGSGESEYFTVYGGLQMALGLVFLWPLVKPEFLTSALLVSLLVHGCLAVFRAVSLISFAGVKNPTFYFASFEWAVFLATLALWWRHRA